SAVKKLMRDAGDDISDLLALSMADRRGYGPNVSTDELEELEQRIEKILLKVPVHKIESPLNGREIMRILNIPPGPRLKEIKQFLLDEMIEGRLAPGDKETAKKLVQEKFASDTH
ncbi:MAG: RNA nucleotidyltransferase, partial [Armatimonadota bacterium]|nr:RNA nucleotidyltransferase [Armatimonadota bacterium]